MISEIHIQNFKSIHDLVLKPGRVTVLIGENGSGKSNILEAIGFAAGAATDKLDREFLTSRGIRVSESPWMTSAFPVKHGLKRNEEIKLQVQVPKIKGLIDLTVSPKVRPEDESFAGWKITVPVEQAEIDRVKDKQQVLDFVDLVSKSINASASQIESGASKALVLNHFAKTFAYRDKLRSVRENAEENGWAGFVIYAPENTALRTFDSETAIEPLGVKGEGLLKLLQSFADGKFKERLADLKERLHLFGWFDDFILPSTEDAVRDRLQLKDRWLAPERSVFDQRSANEGFLYVLFYLTLIMSWRTPKFFAIDNIDSALNPKMCATLMQQIAELAKKYDKQVICTTHNPMILDGLNINDDAQRLYTVLRNSEGHTILNRVKPPKTREGKQPTKLSVAFMSGDIGGLPDHF